MTNLSDANASVSVQNLDMQLQRALNMDDFDRAQDIRTRREQVDEVVAQHLVCPCGVL